MCVYFELYVGVANNEMVLELKWNTNTNTYMYLYTTASKYVPLSLQPLYLSFSGVSC